MFIFIFIFFKLYCNLYIKKVTVISFTKMITLIFTAKLTNLPRKIKFLPRNFYCVELYSTLIMQCHGVGALCIKKNEWYKEMIIQRSRSEFYDELGHLHCQRCIITIYAVCVTFNHATYELYFVFFFILSFLSTNPISL